MTKTLTVFWLSMVNGGSELRKNVKYRIILMFFVSQLSEIA